MYLHPRREGKVAIEVPPQKKREKEKKFEKKS